MHRYRVDLRPIQQLEKGYQALKATVGHKWGRVLNGAATSNRKSSSERPLQATWGAKSLLQGRIAHDRLSSMRDAADRLGTTAPSTQCHPTAWTSPPFAARASYRETATQGGSETHPSKIRFAGIRRH
jgi:hypothetical protein